MSERLLVLVRHGQSEWNLKNLFTGWRDPDLTALGVEVRGRVVSYFEGNEQARTPALRITAPNRGAMLGTA